MSLSAMIRRTGRKYGYHSVGGRQPVGRRYSIPAPVKGWNTRDGYANMKPEYAVLLDNYFPDHGAVALRKGFQEHSTGVGSGDVESLFSQVSGATERLWAAGGGAIYNATTFDAAASEVKGGFSSNRWHEADFGGRIVLVNGVDDPQRIEANGSFAAAHNWAAATGQPALVPSALHRVLPFKSRLLFLEKDTPNLWYGALGAIQGDLSRISLAQVHPRGGNAVALGTVTRDGGTGTDDLLVVFMSSGAALVYQGTDPADTDNWGLVGIFEIGQLVGDRPLVRFGGDLIAMTVDGYVPVRRKMVGAASEEVDITDTISAAVADVSEIYGAESGWDCIHYPRAKWLMFNVPQSGGIQHVMNTQTRAWARFTGMDARSWTAFKNGIYFGGVDGKVYQANVGGSDGDGPIEGDVQGAFNYLGSPMDKRFTMMRALVEANGPTNFQLGSTTDFGAVGQLSPHTTVQTAGAAWNSADWNVASWAQGSAVVRDWQAVNRDGTAISIRLRSSTRGVEVKLYAVDVIAERTSGLL